MFVCILIVTVESCHWSVLDTGENGQSCLEENQRQICQSTPRLTYTHRIHLKRFHLVISERLHQQDQFEKAASFHEIST